MGELHRSNMIFRRQLITAATAIVTVLSLCCLVATEAHTLSDAIVPEATSDTADLLVLADQYSDTADLLTDAASWEKRALAAESSENKLKIELRGEQAEVKRLTDALHPALGKPVGSTGRTPVSHVDSVESKPIHLVDGTIPLLTVNDPWLSWTPYTFLSVGGGTPVKVLVDTGSSVTALCPGTDIGSAVSENEYGCCQYLDSQGTKNGWVGQHYKGSVVLGDQSKLVSDPNDMTVALVTSQNTGICTPNIKGIMGVDYGRGKKYGTPPQAIRSPITGKLSLYRKKFPTSNWTGCPGVSTEFKTSFDGTMMVAADEYKFAFIGVNTHNTGNPVMAFGITTTELLRSAKSVGQADFTSQAGYDKIWYSFSDDAHFAIKNWKPCDDDASKCEYTYPSPKSGGTPAVIDSGTQKIVLPNAFWSGVMSIIETLDMKLNAAALKHNSSTIVKYKLPSSTTLEITIGSATVVLPLLELFEKGHIRGSGSATSQPIIGFPAFWYYDFLFHIGDPKSLVGGTLSVFSRD